MPSQEEMERQQQEQLRQDSIAAAQIDEDTEPQDPDVQRETEINETIQETQQTTEPSRPSFGVFEDSGIADTSLAVVRTPLYEIQLTNVGAGPSKYTLLGHKTWDQKLVQMIADTTQSAYSMEFLSFQNYNIETDQLVFEPLFDQNEFSISDDDSVTIAYRLPVENNASIVFTYTFYADQYAYDLDIELNDMQQYISGTNVEFGWKSPLNLTEKDRVLDAQNSMAYTYAGGVLEKFKLEEAGQNE